MTSSTITPLAKVRPNDPCWCGSGLKFKRCHRPTTDRVAPGEVSPVRPVPEEIERPHYAEHGGTDDRDEAMVKSPELLERMRRTGSAAAEVLRQVGDAIEPGVTTDELDALCHRLCIDYARERTLWGQEIGRFQLIQLKLAKMEVARINVQNMVFHSIERARAGKPLSLAEASAMKLYSSEAATDVAMDAVQLFGGNGYMAEYRVEQLARDAKSLMIYAGSNEIQVTHIAKGLLAR